MAAKIFENLISTDNQVLGIVSGIVIVLFILWIIFGNIYWNINFGERK